MATEALERVLVAFAGADAERGLDGLALARRRAREREQPLRDARHALRLPVEHLKIFAQEGAEE